MVTGCSSSACLIVGAGTDRQLPVDHQRAIEIGVAAAAHQLRQHVERRLRRMPRWWRTRQIIAPQRGLLDPRIGQRDGARRRGRGSCGRMGAPIRGLRRDLAEGALASGRISLMSTSPAITSVALFGA